MLNKLTIIHKKILEDIVAEFINKCEMPNRKVFRVAHAGDLDDIDFMEKSGVLKTEGESYKIPLWFFKNTLQWQKEKRITNKILKNMRTLYLNDPLARFPVEHVVPRDEYALQPSGIKRALYYLREVGLISGGQLNTEGQYITVSPHENVIRVDDVDEVIDNEVNVVWEEERTIAHNSSDKQKNWRFVKDLGRGGQGSVSLVEKLGYHNEVINKVVEMVRVLVKSENAETINKLAYSMPHFFYEFADDLKRNTHRGALKQLHASNNRDYSKALERMEKEISGMEQIDHPNIVKILDKNLKDGWFVMEYFEHGTLDKHLSRFKGDARGSLAAFRRLVEALALMHSQKLIHRDIKPQNIYLNTSNELIVGDLGLIFMQENDVSRISEAYENVGSRDWMPAWAQGKKLPLDEITTAFDVFCLAKVLWAMISGRTKLQLWYYDHEEYNLERLFPDKEEMPLVNKLLSKCIVQFERDIKIKDATELLREIDKTIIQIDNKTQQLASNIKRKCKVCGNGTYELIVNGNPTAAHNFGISPTGNSGFKIYTCNNCGHVQLFYFSDVHNELPAWAGDMPGGKIHRQARGMP